MKIRRVFITLIALTIGAGTAVQAQTSPQLVWRGPSTVASAATGAPQLLSAKEARLSLPPLLDKSNAVQIAPSQLARVEAPVDARPLCAMPVATAPAGRSDSMAVQRTDMERMERMPVAPSACRSTP